MAVLCSDGCSNGEEAGRCTSGGRIRAGWRALTGTGIALAACLGLSTAPALGLAGRGHVFNFSFSTAGVPSGVAVDEATGRVYVARQGGPGEASCAVGCIQEFEPAREARPIATIEVPDPGSIAVDNSPTSPSHGDVYVAGTTRKAVKQGAPEDNIVYKFSASGALLAKLKKYKTEKGESEELAPVSGLAVDGGGTLFVYDEEGEVARFNNAEKNRSLLSLEPEFVAHATSGLAIDPNGVLYLGHESENPVAEGPAGEPPVVGSCQAPEPERECETLNPNLISSRRRQWR
jgi:DNA-binding beta-propeller fold protein YncE